MNDQPGHESARIFNLEAYRKSPDDVPEWIVPQSPFMQLSEIFKSAAWHIRQTPFFLKLVPERRMCYRADQLEGIAKVPFLKADLKEGTHVIASYMAVRRTPDGVSHLHNAGIYMSAKDNGRRITFFQGVPGGDGVRFEVLRRRPDYYEFERMYKIENGKTRQLPLSQEAVEQFCGNIVPTRNRWRQQRSPNQPLVT